MGGYPKMVGLMENPIKMDDLGYPWVPPFQEMPNWFFDPQTSHLVEKNKAFHFSTGHTLLKAFFLGAISPSAQCDHHELECQWLSQSVEVEAQLSILNF